jgi:hypothetical protein
MDSRLMLWALLAADIEKLCKAVPSRAALAGQRRKRRTPLFSHSRHVNQFEPDLGCRAQAYRADNR